MISMYFSAFSSTLFLLNALIYFIFQSHRSVSVTLKLAKHRETESLQPEPSKRHFDLCEYGNKMTEVMLFHFTEVPCCLWWLLMIDGGKLQDSLMFIYGYESHQALSQNILAVIQIDEIVENVRVWETKQLPNYTEEEHNPV